jgi:hypothetical protein
MYSHMLMDYPNLKFNNGIILTTVLHLLFDGDENLIFETIS